MLKHWSQFKKLCGTWETSRALRTSATRTGPGASGVSLSLWTQLRESANLERALVELSLFGVVTIASHWLMQRIPIPFELPTKGSADHFEIMIQLGLTIVFWTCIAATAGHAVYLARSGQFTLWPGRGTAVTATGLCVLVVGADLFFAFIVPFSIMQDIVAAQEGLRGHALPSMHINSLVKAALAEEPRPDRLTAFWPALTNEVNRDYCTVPKVISEEAHPPFFVLLISPFVYFFGIRGTSLAMAGLSVGSFALTLWLLRCGMNFKMKPDRALLITVLLLGWGPMSWVLRAGQTGAILGALIVIAWFCIRKGRPFLAGAAVAVATSIKIFPALLLLYFLLRHRRALQSAAVIVVALNLLSMAVWGRQAYLDWAQTARFIVQKDWAAPDNWSLLGFLGKLQGHDSIATPISRIAFALLSLIVVGALCWAVSKGRAKGSAAAQCDVEYSLFVAAMPLLCPICWSHYFVILLLPLAVLARTVWQNGPDFVPISSFFVLFVVLSASGLIGTAYNEGLPIAHSLAALPTMALAGVLSWNILLVWRNASLDVEGALAHSPERRAAPRHSFLAPVQLTDVQSEKQLAARNKDTHLRARISDLSLTGCYLDTTNFLPVGTEVRLNISHKDAVFTALGVIASSQPNFGMGVKFTDVPLDQHALLDKWLTE